MEAFLPGMSGKRGRGRMKHILWLIKQMFLLPLKGDISGGYEALQLLKLHLCYRSKRIK